MNTQFASVYDQNPARRAIIMSRKRRQKTLFVQALLGLQAVLGGAAVYFGIS